MKILGVDSGGTKTRSIITNLDCGLLGTGMGGPGNYHYIGVERARKSMRKTIDMAMADAQVKPEDVPYGVFGVGGLDTAADYEVIAGFLEDIGYPKRRYIVNDVVISHYAVNGGAPGVTVVAGTGSIAYGTTRNGESCRVGGWGWIIGDEGSGAYAAIRGLREASKAWDGRGDPTMLTELACEHFDLEASDVPRKVISKVQGADLPEDIAPFAVCVTEAAARGDEVAMRIIDEGCEELANLAATAVERLELEPPVMVGSVGGFATNDLVFEKFEEKVKNKIPEVEVLKPVRNPVVGAVALVMEKIGKEVSVEDLRDLDSEIEDRVEEAEGSKSGFEV
ncbi:hypothetical protein AKJ41_00065 [candidate division MSBL1 archaeon SCGC-AAA259O05]|uniref:ATPase BadF/BadG/BcrA/BcrD type domain-containing protein n=1 Tax=candidate division MSBL1 archaeon SCGC-AAA259O05 TaxID=1698271 RepID=A0A133V5T5_9EURY|nr:hypothetical protein AKJ41_00065 [candidate division MSBL1 archaeon SCGC-AAA259O05]